MKIYKLLEKPNKGISNILLFSLAFLFIFVVPAFPVKWHPHINDVLFSSMFFIGVYVLDNVKKSVLIIAIIAFLTQWISSIFTLDSL